MEVQQGCTLVLLHRDCNAGNAGNMTATLGRRHSRPPPWLHMCPSSRFTSVQASCSTSVQATASQVSKPPASQVPKLLLHKCPSLLLHKCPSALLHKCPSILAQRLPVPWLPRLPAATSAPSGHLGPQRPPRPAAATPRRPSHKDLLRLGYASCARYAARPAVATLAPSRHPKETFPQGSATARHASCACYAARPAAATPARSGHPGPPATPYWTKVALQGQHDSYTDESSWSTTS